MYWILLAVAVLNWVFQVKANTLCVAEDASCSYQLWPVGNATKDACHMTYFPRNSTSCKSLQFSAKSTAKDLGSIRIRSYLNHKYRAVLFNITFSEIKWKTAAMRFMEARNSNDVICSARTFKLSQEPNGGIFHYDCPFVGGEDDGRIFKADFEMTSGSSVEIRKIIFKVPSYSDMDTELLTTRALFTYVDYTDLNGVILKIQRLGANCSIMYYKVEVWRERDGRITKMDVRFIDPATEIEGEIKFTYNTRSEWGDYFFVVSFMNEICPEDTCSKTSTPKISIDRRNSRLVIAIVGASVIIPVLLYVVYMWNKQCKFQEALVDFSEIKALLIYTPQTEYHNNAVVAFAQMLQKTFRIHVLIDIFDIQQTKHKNPGMWCSEVVQQATHIIYVAPPNTSETYPSVYKTEPVAIRFLEEYLASGRSDKKIISITFPYSKRNVPELFKNFRHFHLMKDFAAFISYLVNYNRQNVILCKSIFKRNRLMYYTEDLYYLELQEAVKKAQAEVKLTKKMSKTKKPEIKVLVPSEENIMGKHMETENDTLIKKEGEYAFDVKELNLSGEREDDLKEVALPKAGSFDIRSLDL